MQRYEIFQRTPLIDSEKVSWNGNFCLVCLCLRLVQKCRRSSYPIRLNNAKNYL